MVRLATIGTNFITDWLMEGVLELPDIELVAVYSRSMEKGKEFAAKYGVEKFMITMKKWRKILKLTQYMWQVLHAVIIYIPLQ